LRVQKFTRSFMSSRILILTILVACSFTAVAQKKLTPAQKKFSDSLTRVLTGKSDSLRYQVYVRLFNKNKAKSYNRAIIVGKRGLPFVRKLGTLEELAIFYRELASLECKFGEENAAAPYFRESARIYKSLNQPATQASVYEDFVKCSETKADFKTAYRYELLARKIRDSIYQNIETKKYDELLTRSEREKEVGDSTIAAQREKLDTLSSSSVQSAEYNKNIIMIVGSALAIFFLLTVVYFAGRRKFKSRLQQERAAKQVEKKERVQISKDVHEVLGEELLQINSLALTVVAKSKSDDTRQPAKSIADISANLMDSTRDLVWQLNLESSNLEALISKIREFSTEILEPTAIELVSRYPESIPPLFLQKVAFRNIYIVVKETFSNVVKHSRAMNASVTVAITNERLHITIKDDGLGFDRMYEKGRGIENMETRMRAIGGLVNIVSELNHGSTVNIDIGLIQIARK
jgi:signal transduction histidine kinase